MSDGESGIEGPPQVISHSFSISVGQGIPQRHKLVPGLALVENSQSLSNSSRQIALQPGSPEHQGCVEGHNLRLRQGSLPLQNVLKDLLVHRAVTTAQLIETSTGEAQIFRGGGIMRCDIIAEGVVSAARSLGLDKPLVVRLEGTNVEEGKRIMAESGLDIIPADNLADAAAKIVAATA